MSVKRERSVNFSREETDLLMKLVGENLSTIENKKSDGLTWAEKDKCWKAIEQSFNGAGGGLRNPVQEYRTAKTLKNKYDGVKREMKKKLGCFRAEMYKTCRDETGGGNTAPVLRLSEETNPVITPSEEMVKDLIFLPVEGTESVSNSDGVPEIAKPKPRRLIEKVAKAKLELAEIQKQILEEELRNKRKQFAFEEEERAHKREMWALEKNIFFYNKFKLGSN